MAFFGIGIDELLTLFESEIDQVLAFFGSETDQLLTALYEELTEVPLSTVPAPRIRIFPSRISAGGCTVGQAFATACRF